MTTPRNNDAFQRPKQSSHSWRSPRYLFVMLALVAFAFCACLLWLHHLPTSLPWLAPKEPLLPHPPYRSLFDTQPEIKYVRRAAGDEQKVHVELVTVGTEIEEPTCVYWMSALLTGVDTTMAGWGVENATYMNPLQFLSDVMEARQLHDWDVVLYTPRTVVFSGTDVQSYLDDFIRLSPVHPDGLDVRAVRQGTMVAPLRFGTSSACRAERLFANRSVCADQYLALDTAIEARKEQDAFSYLPEINATDGRSNSPYLHSAFMIARVWALKELIGAYERFSLKMPLVEMDAGQTVFTALYLDLRWGEVNMGLLAPNAGAASLRNAVNQFGLHYGVMDLWHTQAPFALSHTGGISDMRVDARLYGFMYDTPMLQLKWMKIRASSLIDGILATVDDPRQYVRTVPVHYTHPQHVRTVLVAPSLLARNVNIMDVKHDGNGVVSMASFPALVNMPEWMPLHFRRQVAQFLGWALAVKLIAGQRNASAALLATTNITVINGATHNVEKINVSACRTYMDMVLDEN